MALVFFDGFGHAAAGSHSEAATDELAAHWRSYSSVTITEKEDAGLGRNCYATAAKQNMFANIIGADGANDFVIGMRLWVNDPTTSQGLFTIQSGRYGTHFFVRIDGTTGYVQVRCNSGSTATSTASVPTQTWFYLEIRIHIAGSPNGTVDFWIDDTPAGAITGIDTFYTTSSAFDTICLFPDEASATEDWDSLNRVTDIYCRNDTTRLGPVVAYYQPCDQAGSDADWTPNTGTNHAAVDDIGPDGDTTYVASSTPTDRDSYNFSDAQAADPAAVQAYCIARCEDGVGAMSIGVRSGATDSLKGVGVDEQYGPRVGSILETDPNTASAWTAAGVNAALAVLEKV